MNNKRLLFIGIFFIVLQSFSQTSIKDDLYVSSLMKYGRIIPNHSNVKYLWNVDYAGIDFRIGKQTIGKELWEQQHLYPDYGIAFSYVYLNHPMFKSHTSVIGYMNGTIYKWRKLTIQHQFGAGLSYWYAVALPSENESNLFIGSKLNAQIDLAVGIEYNLSDYFDLFCRINFLHSSNGAIQLPNLGVNGLAAQLGFKHHIYGSRPKIVNIDTAAFVKRNIFYLFVAPGYRESKVNHLHYYKFALQLGYQRGFHPLMQYGVGIDISYNGDAEAYLSVSQQNKWKYISQAIFGSFEVLYGRFVLHASLGVYVYKSFSYYLPIYERVGFRFLLGQERRHFIGLSIKAHGGSADMIEWTYGVQLFRDLVDNEAMNHTY